MAQADTRRLAAIMFTDIVGFSRQMGSDEARMLGVLAVHNQLIQQAIAEHHGHVIKTLGDAFLVDFPSVVNAVQCAQRIQDRLRTYNSEKDKAEQIHIRIGIHLGDIIYGELGREEEAKAEAAEILRANPDFSLEVFSQRVLIKDPVVAERYLDGLRKAGLK